MKVDYIHHCGSDLTVVNAARVSFDKESGWENAEKKVLKEKDRNLIKYLAGHDHISPFGHAFISFRVKAPIFVARQLVKHKFLRWNEVSRRYVDSDPEFYEPKVWRDKADNVKQGSGSGSVVDLRVQGFGVQTVTDAALKHKEHSLDLYKDMIEAGVAPEMARMALPQSVYTEWYWSGSLDAFASMCNLRCYPDAQYETKVVADMIDEKMGELFPVSWGALRND